MPNWKKVIVSGSDAVLGNITASNISASGHISASNFIGNFPSLNLQQVTDNGAITTNQVQFTDGIDFSNANNVAIKYDTSNSELIVNEGDEDITPVIRHFGGSVSSSFNELDFSINGTIKATKHLFASASEDNSIPNVALYDTESGKFYYTASSAIGGNTNTPTLDEVTTAGNTTTNSITVNSLTSTGKGGISASFIVNHQASLIEGKSALSSVSYDPAYPAGTLVLGLNTHWQNFVYGNSSTLSHTFEGHITASGNISASGDIEGDHISSSQIHLENYIERNGFTGTYFGFAGNNKYVVFTNNIKRMEVVNAGVSVNGDIQLDGTSSLRESNAGNLLYLGNDADWKGIEYGRTTSTYHQFNGEEILIPNIPVNNPTSTTGTNVLTYNSSTGQILATGSYGSTGNVGTLQEVTDNGSITSNPITSSANIALSASGDIIATNVTASNAFHAQAGSQFEFTIADSQFNMINQAADKNLFFKTSTGTGTINFGTNNIDSEIIIGTGGHITASGNISSSANIYADKYYTQESKSLSIKSNKLEIGNDTNWNGFTYGFTGGISTATHLFSGDVEIASPHSLFVSRHITASGDIIAGANSALEGKISASGHLFASASENSSISNVALYDTSTGKFFYTASNQIGKETTPGGSNKQVQFNNNGSFDGDNGFEYDSSTKTIDLDGPTGFNIDATVSNGALNITSNNDIINEVTGDFDVKLGESSEFRVYQVNSGNMRMKVDQFGDVTMEESLAVGSISPSSTVGRIDASNDVVAFSTSDERLKKYIKPIPNALDKVSQIRGVEFDWKVTDQKMRDEVHSFEGHDVGVLAQEVEKVLPEVVTTRNNGYKAVKYEKIVPLLIESIKELKAEIEELKKSK